MRIVRKGKGWFRLGGIRYLGIGWDYRELLMLGVRWDFPTDGLCFYMLGWRVFVPYELMWRVCNGLLGVRIREALGVRETK